MVVALGAEKVILVEEIEEALAFTRDQQGILAFCDGAPRPGFDLFNSPAQLESLDVDGRIIVQRTTAGTQGAVASRHSKPLLCTGFVTAAATATYVRHSGVDAVCFVVTGGDEDVACAEHIAALLAGEAPGDRFVARARGSEAARKLTEHVTQGFPGVHADDVELCLEVDRFEFAMLASDEDGHLVLRAVGPASQPHA